MKEKAIEQKLIQAVRRSGGMAVKFVSPGHSGMPDRMVLFPGGQIAFVEVKAPGKKPRPLQSAVHEKLRSLGFAVYVVDSAALIDQFIKEMAEGARGRSESPRRKENEV